MKLLSLLIISLILLAFLSSFGSKSRDSSSSSSFNSTDETLSYAYCRTCKYYPAYGRNCTHRRGGAMQVNDNTKACTYWECD